MAKHESQIVRDEHDESLNAKKVSLVSASTIYAVVNTGAAGDSVAKIGFATVAVASSVTVYAVVNTAAAGEASIALDNSVSKIGFATTYPAAAWPDPKTYIGLVTITGSLAAAAGNVTLDAGSKTGIVGNVTISDSKGFIGLVTVGNTVSTTFAGNVTLDAGSKTAIVGNVTISDSKGFIGLVTVGNTVNSAVIGNLTLSDPKGFIGLTTTVNGQAWPDPKTYIGLVTVGHTVTVGAHALTAGAAYIGLATVDIGTTKAWADPKTYLGLVTIDVGTIKAWADPKTYLGLVTVGHTVTSAIAGNLTLSDPKGFIGLTTAVNGQAWPDPKTYIGLVTITGSLSAAAGNITLDAGSKTGVVGNITLSDSKSYIGLVTLGGGTAWTDPKTYIGLVTITGSLSAAAGNITLDAGSKTGIVGNITLSDPKTFIGSVSVSHAAWANPNTFIGLVTASNGLAWTDPKTFIGLTTAVNGQAWPDPKTYLGLVTVGHTVTVAAHGITGNLTLSDAKTFIGLVSIGGGPVNILGNVTLSDAKTYIGLTTTTLGIGTTFVGLVTAWTRNAGSAKTLVTLPVTLSTASTATLVVPTNANVIYATNILLNSDATVRVSIKSGVTYLTGNASIGITLNPGGGWVETGAPDSPTFIGCPSGALVVEKFDMTATKANVGGKITYFTE